MTELLEQILPIVFLIIPFIFGMIAKFPQYVVAKSKISQTKDLFDEINVALLDDNVTESEFRKIFFSAKRIIKK